ncbi:GNAT family N-acetyltransferase [Olivibacter domesticus]|uniref:Acetyltransferase (GNAT) domain-containing protein n=1 Tax=Olivibacter domesticus TaxID=407022 RepID=A0A1H7Z7S0_OLID1|nr:GNAT family N-acetyltransferase [Olivibacter domesticus]SEM53618.1 Acetyltransferase (GNAT) domain-containing protein [Olivibacter domesticus]
MNITYKVDVIPSAEQIIELYNDAPLSRPTTDSLRIGKMYEQSNLVITAWNGDELVGVARSLTDFCFACYLSDLAVKKHYQKFGIGRELVSLTKKKIGDQSMLLLLSVETAMEYYPKIGMHKVENGFIINRLR